jgi:hypothetical protein
MASQTAKGSGSTVNNGGTFIGGGGSATEKADSAMSNNIDLNDVNGAVDVSARYGSKIVAKTGTGASTTNPDGVQTSKGTGTLAYFPAQADGNWIVRAAGTTAAGKINNSATTRLHIPAAEGEFGKLRVPQPHIADRRLGTGAEYDIFAIPSTERTPNFTAGANAGDVLEFQNTEDTTKAEFAEVKDSRNVPGELTYMFGGKSPKRDDYKPRDTFES